MLVQVRTAPKHRSTHISNYESTERESYERDENYIDDSSHVSSGALFSIKEFVQACLLLQKRIGPPCCTLFTFVTCCSLQIILWQNYLLPIISVLAENTLLKTAYHFLLLLVGFDTLTYRKDYDRSPILVGHQHRSQPREAGARGTTGGGLGGWSKKTRGWRSNTAVGWTSYDQWS